MRLPLPPFAPDAVFAAQANHLRGSAEATLRTLEGVARESLTTLVRNTPDGWEDLRYDLAHVRTSFEELAGKRNKSWVDHQPVSRALIRGTRLDGDDARHLSNQTLTEALARIHEMGAGSIVDLRAEATHEPKIAEAAGIPFKSIPIVDNWHPTVRQVRSFLDFVSDPDNQPVYVHCQAGIGRTGLMVACYRIAIEGWTAEQALTEMQGFTSTRLRPNQARFIQGFEAKLLQRRRGLTDAKLEHWRAHAR